MCLTAACILALATRKSNEMHLDSWNALEGDVRLVNTNEEVLDEWRGECTGCVLILTLILIMSLCVCVCLRWSLFREDYYYY